MPRRTRSAISLVRRNAALLSHAGHAPGERTKHLQRGLAATFEQALDPDGILSPEERRRRGDLYRRAWMAYLASYAADHRSPPLAMQEWIAKHVRPVRREDLK